MATHYLASAASCIGTASAYVRVQRRVVAFNGTMFNELAFNNESLAEEIELTSSAAATASTTGTLLVREGKFLVAAPQASVTVVSTLRKRSRMAATAAVSATTTSTLSKEAPLAAAASAGASVTAVLRVAKQLSSTAAANATSTAALRVYFVTHELGYAMDSGSIRMSVGTVGALNASVRSTSPSVRVSTTGVTASRG